MDPNRYERQVNLPEIGLEGQKKLSRAKVLIVGAGGLGSPISTYLTGAGVGTIGLMDDDVVSLNNLHRQVLYSEALIGQPKVLRAAERLRALNSEFGGGDLPFGLEVHVHQDIVVIDADDFTFDDGAFFEVAKVGVEVVFKGTFERNFILMPGCIVCHAAMPPNNLPR